MQARQLPKGLPETVESPRGKLVYLFLQFHEGATLDELRDGLDLQRITLFGVLKTLEERGVVERRNDRYVTARPA
ncbi:MAG: TrmB family transcriptional regulator [Halarchaeum sp.]